jgi:SAM-dependent methyltransferase
VVTDVTSTGLADRCADVVMCIDVLQVLDDHGALLRETARLLKPGGRAVITTWEGRGSAPGRFPRDLRCLITGAGLRPGPLLEQPAWLEASFASTSRPRPTPAMTTRRWPTLRRRGAAGSLGTP